MCHTQVLEELATGKRLFVTQAVRAAASFAIGMTTTFTDTNQALAKALVSTKDEVKRLQEEVEFLRREKAEAAQEAEVTRLSLEHANNKLDFIVKAISEG
jgi:hypothetical protein